MRTGHALHAVHDNDQRRPRAAAGRRSRSAFLAAAAVVLFPLSASAGTRSVGPGQMYATPCAAIAAAIPGDVIEIDAAGSYDGDVCGWSTSQLTIRGVNGRAKIDAAGKNSQGKAIWVIAGDDTVIENVELSGCTVPDKNGAGIRQEGRNLTVRGCYFHDNEDGILAGDKDGSTITFERTEFANNGAGDGLSHNFYVNHVDKLVMTECWSHDAKIGHLAKSRAKENWITYSRLTDQGGTASYELDLPNGGTSYVIGNLFHQSATTDNNIIISFIEEGANAKNPGHDLYVVNNTFVSDTANATVVKLGGSADPLRLVNNVFRGAGSWTNQGNAVMTSNLAMTDPKLASQATYDFHLLAASPAIDAGTDPGMSTGGLPLAPTRQYVHPVSSEPRPSNGPIDQGAYEFGAAAGAGGSSGSGGATSAGTGGTTAAGAGGSTTAGAGGSTTAGAGGSATGGAGGSTTAGAAGSTTAGSGGTTSAGASGSTAAGSGGAKAGAGGATAGAAGKSSAGSSAAGKAGAASSGASGKAGAGAAGASAAASPAESDGGCGCQVVPTTPPFVLFLAPFALLRRRRRAN